MRLPDGSGGTNMSSGQPYVNILHHIATQGEGGGSNYDRPMKLLLNGEVMVERGLTDLAYAYLKDKRDLAKEANNTLLNLHTPAWYPEDEAPPGFNPPGIDVWKIEKRD